MVTVAADEGLAAVLGVRHLQTLLTFCFCFPKSFAHLSLHLLVGLARQHYWDFFQLEFDFCIPSTLIDCLFWVRSWHPSHLCRLDCFLSCMAVALGRALARSMLASRDLQRGRALWLLRPGED